jgi:hypothetical protein
MEFSSVHILSIQCKKRLRQSNSVGEVDSPSLLIDFYVPVFTPDRH